MSLEHIMVWFISALFFSIFQDCRILQNFYNADVFKGLSSTQVTALKDNIFICASTTIMNSWTKDVFTSL